MGYRSQTIYAITGPKDKLVTFITALKIQHPEVSAALNECLLMPYGDDELVLALDAPDWKWYENYPEIQAHEKIWSCAEEQSEEYNLAGAFGQVGENDDDCTTRYFGEEDSYSLVRLHRSVEADFVFDADLDIRKEAK